MTESFFPYLFTEAFCILYALTILLRLHKGGGRETGWLRKIILTYIVVVAADMISTLATGDARPWARALNAAFNAVAVAGVALGCYLWFVFVEYRLAAGAQHPQWRRTLAAAPAAVMCALDLLSGFTGWIFYVDAGGNYRLGSLFWLQSVTTFAYLLLPTAHAAFMAFRTHQREKRAEYLTYIVFIAIPIAGVVVEDSFPRVPLLELSIFAIIQLLFLILYVDREYELAKKERELTESRMAIMLSQIQPHFLYNALGTVAALCRSDPAKAEQITLKFSDFLRGNLDSLTAERTIPFGQELTHARNYLDIEQVRFGARLNTVFDIATTEFRLPTLTLQPIVENAVRYGVTKRENGGTVRISTRENADGFEIVVEDDGVGFDPMQPHEDGRTHIGIQNVRERLERMCGGSLIIDTQPGIGTRAVIRIPRTEA
ncbi:MAG: histidine kinase [Oscillospiraceae bacterium]|nr:histidine kinase [Oscillospiraceae bacterium]